MTIKYSIGLDISSKKVNGSISLIDENQKVSVKSSIVFYNTLKGFLELSLWIKKWHTQPEIPLVICMEATGVYHENCALYLFEKGHAVSIILPNKAKHYLISMGLKSKNDSIDAKGLSKMGAEQCLGLWQPAGKYFYELRQYTRQHQNLQEQKTVINNQLHALEFGMYDIKPVVKQLKKVVQLFDKQIKELDKIIKKHLESNQIVKQKVVNICQIKGIGILTVATILAETNGFELFKNYKQLVSYAGFDVVERESGSSVTGKTRISKKGNSHIRRALFMPAFTAVKYQEPSLFGLYERTYAKHAIKMKSYVAVQKKLLTTIYHLWKKNEEYNPNYIFIIQEKEQKLSSLLGFAKAASTQKNSPNQVEAIQGKHPMKNQSRLPLC
jgi:transposase